MKKEWKEPKLESLDIKETMYGKNGSSWDGFFLGRYNKPDPNPGEDIS